MLGGGVLAAVLAGSLLASGGGDIPEGARVGGIDIGSLPESTARDAIQRRAQTVLSRAIRISSPTVPGMSITISPRSLRPRALVDEALASAREGDGRVERLLARLGLGGENTVPLRFALDAGRTQAVIDQVQRRFGRPPVDGGLAVTETGIIATKAREGRGVDPELLRAKLVELPTEISLPVGDIPPAISDEAVEAARLAATHATSTPVSVSAEKTQAVLSVGALRRALRFVPEAPVLRVAFDPATLGTTLRRPFAPLTQPVRDARFRVDGTTVTVVPEAAGARLRLDLIAQKLSTAPGEPIAAELARIAPARTAAQLEKLGITGLVGEFTTPYNCCEPRVTNIQQAAKVLDQTIIPAGARFSLNDALGERTEAKGFVSAPQISGGELKDAIGGGVSQMATTIYNASFFAGLELITHTPHEFYISRYPPGREATVSWGGPELIVRNDWSAAILMDVAAGDNGVTVRMFSSPLGRRVETESGERHDFTESKTREQPDPTLAPGERITTQFGGGQGFTIEYTRRVYRGDELKRDENFSWRYTAEDTIVKIGPGTPTTTTPDETTTGETTPPEAPPVATAPSSPTPPSAPPAPGGATPPPPPSG